MNENDQLTDAMLVERIKAMALAIAALADSDPEGIIELQAVLNVYVRRLLAMREDALFGNVTAQ